MVSIHILMRDSTLGLGGLSQWLKNFIAEDAIASMTHCHKLDKNQCLHIPF